MGLYSIKYVKPKLLLNAGYPSSGNTSLYYTLWSNNYGHGGNVKESNYLLHIQSPQAQKNREKLHQRKKKYGKGIYRPWSLPDSIFMSEHTFDKKPSIDNYISYYVKLWRDIDDKYQSLLDFSNSEQQLTEKFMMSIRDELLKYFDIKVVMMLRDPIRRLWSVCNRKSLTEGGTPQSHMEFNDPYLSYIEKYERYIRVWGKDRVKFIINENFYKGNMQPLSEFLQFPISPTYVDVTHLTSVKNKIYSQWCDLEYKTWKYAYKNMKWVYDEFENKFGYIPNDWASCI